MVASHSIAALIASWLLWSPHHGADASPYPGGTTNMSPLVTTTIPSSTQDPLLCIKDEDCGDLSNLYCDTDSKKCSCKESYLVLSSKLHCVPVKLLGESCDVVEQCQSNDKFSQCSAGICSCMPGYIIPVASNATTNSCISDGTGGTTPRPTPPPHQIDPNMIIIMVVLAIMFVGICVALNLFSRARFRNHRTIFNSPHPRLMHIKLGRKKGRRRTSHTSLEMPGSRQLSICSQLSPVPSRQGSRAGSRAGSPDFVRSHQRSGDKRRERPESLSTADGEKKHTTGNSATGGSTIPNGPGSPTVIITNGSGPSPASSPTARV